jgi:hypothetical protein
MTGDFLRGLHSFARSLHRSCPAVLADDLLQDALEHDVSGGCAVELYRIVSARNAMRSMCRRESWWQARVDHDADPDLRAAPERPDVALDTLRLRRIVRSRIQAHVTAAPELRPAVEVVLYEERPRAVAEQLQLPVEDIYAASASLRARLREDEELQRLYREAA